MEEKKKMDKKDTYIMVLIGLFYLYIYGKNVIAAVLHATGWDWIGVIILSVVALFICASAWIFSCGIVIEAIKYFGLPKSYLVLTILSIVIAPLTIIVLLLFLSGTIPSIFDPRFL